MASCRVCGNEVSGEVCHLCGTQVRPSGDSHGPASTEQPARPSPLDVAPSATASLPSSTSTGAPDRSKVVFGAIAGAALLGAIIVFAVSRGGDDDVPAYVATHTETVTSVASSPSPVDTETDPEPEASESTDDGVVRELETGSWIIVFRSLEQDRYTAEEALQQSADFPGSVVVDSSSIPGLRAGYWAISSVGYSTQQEARDSCADFGLELGGECYERQIG